jgi:GntR family transcriptional regulator
VNRNRRTPLYAQLEADLRAQINTGALRPGDLLPSEAELGRRHGVSRITVRAALHSLEQDGLLERHSGRGTFVRSSVVESWSCLTSFTEQMLRAGRNPTTRLLALRTVRADAELAALFQTREGEEFAFIERLRLVDDRPAALMRAYIPRRLAPGLQRRHFKLSGREQSILYVLERVFGLVINEGEETTAPVCLTPPESELLGLSDGSPVVFKSCLIHNSLGEPVFLERAYWSVPQTDLVRRAGAATAP